MAILIGAIYVWAFYALAYGWVFAVRGTHSAHILSWVVWASFGVAFSLGVAWLAQRHSPKHVALGLLVLNPGWIWLLFAISYTYVTPSTAPPEFHDPSGESQVLLPIISIVGLGLGVLAILLSLGLITWSLGRVGQKTLGAIMSGVWAYSLPALLNLLRPAGLFENLLVPGLGVAGLIWALTHRETLESATAKRITMPI